ncbi:tRNA pseudouridine(55) synthase TruB [uncultured Clostridium sp.]|jgi:tRNA pseudouridine55 synthase|uniref:tRNA pseudouridine(55) synthase TruB n=1 Tax=uncultured Clostridium sp. TaxID=59620 RepID=UPI002621650F|nr:tRNA pseudouridine(55) synthase TruB [uncultured Clostridium sp.]
MNGVINICKNTGQTSFDVVARVRKIAKIKKVGHTGTLDPEASGVLPICIGRATKIIDYIMENKKVYRVTMKLGVVTDTYDLEGKVIREADASNISEEEALTVVNTFKGDIMQIPPMFSALKKNGVRLYELARKGIEIEREARPITIHSLENIKIELPNITMDVCCSKGTYIRSLCYDIGEKLSVGAVMTSLVRIQNGPFTIDEAVNIEDLTEELLNEHIISIDEALESFEGFVIKNEKFSKLLANGVSVMDNKLYNGIVLKDNKLYRVYDYKGILIGLGKKGSKGFKIEKLLLEE